MSTATHTPGPWEYVPSNENHGPYVCGPFGGDICDCYTMTAPGQPSIRNGGTSKPVLFFHEMADPNARLISAAPDLLAALKLAENVLSHAPFSTEIWPNGIHPNDGITQIRDAIAKAEGRSTERVPSMDSDR